MLKPKWIFGVSQQNPGNSQASPPVDNQLAVAACSADSKEFGLENFGNTCYANSVLQTLYFCIPFRELLLQLPDSSAPPEPIPTQPPSTPPLQSPLNARPWKRERNPSSTDARLIQEAGPVQQLPTPVAPTIPTSPPTLTSALRSLFVHISKNPAEKGTVAPKAFIEKLRQLNELFRSQMHQDAHEFLNYLLNRVVEEVEEARRQGQDSDRPTSLSFTPMNHHPPMTLVHKLFEGVLTSETRCLTCETVSSRDESFLDLSIDIEQNSSVTACLRQFSASEMLCQKNKFFCDSCCDLQEAEKRMKIKKLPNVLALHLKRFKYQDDVQKYIKLTYRVAFPMELKLFNTVDDAEDPDRLYELFGIVIHIGTGPHHGHYISIIKAQGAWKVFDDDTVESIKESDIPRYFGDSNSGSAYVLYYQVVDIDLQSLGLRPPTPPSQLLTEVLLEDGPALPPGLTCENDSTDVSKSSGLATPVSPNPASSPQVFESPTPVKVSIPSPEVSQVPSGSTSIPSQRPRFFHSLRQAPSSRTRFTIATPDTRQLVDGASTVASSSSSTSTGPASTTSSTKAATKPGIDVSSVTSTMTPVTELEPPSSPVTRPKTKDGKEKEKWFRRKSFRTEKKENDKDMLAAPFTTERSKHKEGEDKDKTKSSFTLTSSFSSDMSENRERDDVESESVSNWRTAPFQSALGLTSPIMPPGSPAFPSPPSSFGSETRRTPSPSRVSPSPESTMLAAVDGPSVMLGKPQSGKTKKSLVPRPSTAGARLPAQSSARLTLEVPLILPPLPPTPTSPTSPRLPKPPLAATLNRRVIVAEETSTIHGNGIGNENGHLKRPSSVHAHVGSLGEFAIINSTSSTSTSGTSAGVPKSTAPPSASSNSSGWKKATRKLSLTSAILGFGRKDKCRDKFAAKPVEIGRASSPPSSSFPGSRR